MAKCSHCDGTGVEPGSVIPPVSISINARPGQVMTTTLTYEDVVGLAGFERGSMPTVVYSKALGDRHGSLTPGQSVKIQDGTRFDAIHTGNA